MKNIKFNKKKSLISLTFGLIIYIIFIVLGVSTHLFNPTFLNEFFIVHLVGILIFSFTFYYLPKQGKIALFIFMPIFWGVIYLLPMGLSPETIEHATSIVTDGETHAFIPADSQDYCFFLLLTKEQIKRLKQIRHDNGNKNLFVSFKLINESKSINEIIPLLDNRFDDDALNQRPDIAFPVHILLSEMIPLKKGHSYKITMQIGSIAPNESAPSFPVITMPVGIMDIWRSNSLTEPGKEFAKSVLPLSDNTVTNNHAVIAVTYHWQLGSYLKLVMPYKMRAHGCWIICVISVYMLIVIITTGIMHLTTNRLSKRS